VKSRSPVDDDATDAKGAGAVGLGPAASKGADAVRAEPAASPAASADAADATQVQSGAKGAASGATGARLRPTDTPATEAAPCDACPVRQSASLRKLGLDADAWDYVVALAGNPNTGKSTVFNALTGLRQHTGNWPGKTVARAEGGFAYGEHTYRLVDLPGTYSLLANSVDEEIARDFVLFGQPDVTVVVVDATRLERNLNLVLQVLQITDRAVICLNLMDEAERRGLAIDDRRLARDLGVPVVPTTARSGEGLDLLLEAVADVATGRTMCRPHRVRSGSPELAYAVASLTDTIEAAFPGLPNARWVALRLLDGDARVADAVRSGELGDLAEPAIDTTRVDLETAAGVAR
jgi:ferrous iron transport protein B